MLVNSILIAGLVAATQVAASPCKPPPKYKPIESIQLGPRPYWLVDDMSDSPVKKQLEECKDIKEFKPSAWSIAHRGGGTLFMPEHSVESNLAGARMGAGVLECDVAFTSDRQLVCRHSQCDLHYTTDIVTHPALNAKCTTPFAPAQDGRPATAKCCTSDITLAEFKTLCARMEGANTTATTPEAYLLGAPVWRTELYGRCGTVLTHKEHIRMTDELGLQFTPELKNPAAAYAQQLIDEYRQAGIDPRRVWPQSFHYPDILYWLDNEPAFGAQAVYLDENGETAATFPDAVANLTTYKADGVRIVAPPLPYLVTLDDGGRIVPSAYATRANELGLEIITWSLERSGVLSDGTKGGYYYTTIADAIQTDGDVFELLHVLAKDIGVLGVFSDWSATVTYYANCLGLF
ncbi:Extracellular protein like [Verticillium longisporum]|nr:Extracellular protein like [Verticillium longisporum]